MLGPGSSEEDPDRLTIPLPNQLPLLVSRSGTMVAGTSVAAAHTNSPDTEHRATFHRMMCCDFFRKNDCQIYFTI